MSLDNPSTSALFRAFAMTYDLDANLCESITEIHPTFCE
jgi:hypothetical protein